LSLPKGERARVVIAAVLAMEPEIIVFDEPTTGQDYRGARYILDISRKLHEMGKTVIVITHHLYLMPDYAERVIIMGKGTLLLDAPIRQAFHDIDLLRSTYLSPPQAVVLAQELSRLAGGGADRLLTPREVAACLSPNGLESNHE
jgi:energy-coupling factor transport system ATP-binding protein